MVVSGTLGITHEMIRGESRCAKRSTYNLQKSSAMMTNDYVALRCLLKQQSSVSLQTQQVRVVVAAQHSQVQV